MFSAAVSSATTRIRSLAFASLAIFALMPATGCESEGVRAAVRLRQYRGETIPLVVSTQGVAAQGDLGSLVGDIYSLGRPVPPSNGSELLNDAMRADSVIADQVQRQGVPDAIESHSAVLIRWFILYYRNPTQSLVFMEQTGDLDATSDQPLTGQLVLQLNEVPRSVRRLAFGDSPLPPPWPVVIPHQWRTPFGVPALGAPWPPSADGQSWRHLAASLSSEVRQIQGARAGRVKGLFARLVHANMVTGLDWKAVPFDSDVATGFGVPDGTIFVSSRLVDLLDDDELVAVMAHLMGHECYQHYPGNLETAQITHFASQPAITASEVPKYPEVLLQPPYAYSRYQEIEANRVAVALLAKLDIPPDTLFDALAKVVTNPEFGEQWPTFSQLHHLPRNTADFGRLLDAGVIAPSQVPAL